MREKIIRFFKMWTLPLGMCAGFAVYFLFRYIPWLAPLKALANGDNDYIMPFFIFVMLFTTFCKVNPREIRIKRWHMVMILFQLVCCLAVAVPTHYFPDSPYRVVVQGTLVSLIAHTGTAAAVIAGRLGGNKTTLTTYTIVSNLVAAVMIPAVFPLVEIHSAGSFMEQFLLILRHVFPLLICPFLVAWALREFMPKLHSLVVKFCKSLTFYLWGISLIIAIGLTLRSVENNHFYPHVLLLLAVSGLIVCAWQFGTGKLVSKHYHDYINCGQSLVKRLCRTTIWFWMYCTNVTFALGCQNRWHSHKDGQMSEHQSKKLIPASKMLNILVAIILLYDTEKLVVV